jgi:hypothetical protein
MIDSMEHESGLGPNKPTDPGAWEELSRLDGVHVQTDAIDVHALSIHDMPHEDIMQMLTMPQPYQTVKRMAMFKLAMGPDAESVETASFGDMWIAANEWVHQSNVKRRATPEDGTSGQSQTDQTRVDFS